jgi:flagellar FliL protein
VAIDDRETDGDDDGEVVDVGTEPAKPGWTKRRKAIVAGAAAVLLIAGGGGAYLLSGDAPAESQAHAPEEPDVLKQRVDVPPLLVNLRSPDNAPHFLKVHVMLVPGPKSDAETLKLNVPKLLDAYQPFLRELRPEDLAGSAAVFRIKEQLLIRARETLGEGHVKDVLVQDLIQQ